MWQIILIPFLGTSMGAASVFLLRQAMSERLQRVFTGFAAGVMVSASFSACCSLLLPRLKVWGDLDFYRCVSDLLWECFSC